MTEPTILPIAQQGETILQQRAADVTDLHDPAIQILIDDMQATMLAANGVGIAAPQVFVPRRIITEYADFIARIIQHECDHLDGVLFPERIAT